MSESIPTSWFEKMPIPRFLVKPEGRSAFRALGINNVMLEYFAKSREQVNGKLIEKFLDQSYAQHFQQCFEVCASRKRAVTIQALQGVPGSIRINNFFVSPVLDANGEIEYIDVVGQLDAADQSILQRERDDAISLMSSIFEVSEVGIIVTDHNRQIIRVNDSFIRTYGWERDELLSSDFAALVTPDERGKSKENHDEFIRTGIRSSGELKFIRKDGGVANVLYTSATMELSQKRRFLVTTVMDITLRKQMEESLRRAKEQADAANHAKSTFLANMSHELRTPLNAIIGFSEMMIKETFGPLGHDKYTEYLEDVRSSAGHLLDIINEVLDMSKIEAGRIELDEDNVNVAELIESVVRMMVSKAFSSNVKIESDVQKGLPHLLADQRLLRQILINLLANAVKFSEEGGRIDVKCEILQSGEMQILIEDEGVGIPKEKITQVLEPFGQVFDRVDNAHQEGTGLGLPLAKAMVELHDGQLELKSDTGQGTKVYVDFPAERIIENQ